MAKLEMMHKKQMSLFYFMFKMKGISCFKRNSERHLYKIKNEDTLMIKNE